MSYYWPDPEPLLPESEERLRCDYSWETAFYPTDPKGRDQYFRDGMELLREVTNQPDKVRKVLLNYLHFAVDPGLRQDLEEFLASLPTAVTTATEPDEETR
jgi:hypothetical protein